MTRSQTDVLDWSITSGDAAGDGRLLSVAELQQGFRTLLVDLRTRPPQGLVAAAPGGGAAATIDADICPGSPLDGAADVDAGWITVLAAHSGAGASTVALTIADAAAADGHAAHLVESAHPARSGLVAASSSELGLDATGRWRRGRRGEVIIDRRAGDRTPPGRHAMGSADVVTVLDLGLPSVDDLTRLAASGARCVLVCRSTIPGVRLAEQALAALANVVVVAVVGPGRWPGDVAASLGPRLRRLRAQGRVVTVPIERRIEVTGPTHSPLPTSVLTAGRSLLRLIDLARPGAGTTTAHRVLRPEGTTR